MNAQQLKNSILQEAIMGKLVPQDPNDEPASVLLDKIREEKKQLVKEGKLKKKDLVETPINEDEIPFEIPESWEWVRIKDIFVINPKVIADDDADAAFIPMEKIEACYGSKFSYEIRKWKTIKSSFTCFADDDVAFAKITPCFQNRKSMILKNLPNGLGAGTTELKVLRQYAETIERKYLLYFLASSYFIDEATFKGTANQQRIIVGYLENKIFPLPPLAEQKRIVSKIEELLPKIDEYGKAQESLDKLNEELPERLKKSILQEAIEGRLVPQDPNDEPASVLLDKIRAEKKRLMKEGKLKKKDLEETPISEDETPFEIPDSWEWVKFGNLVSTSTGKTPARGNTDFWGNDYPWVSISDMKQGEIIKSTKECISQKAANDCFHNVISTKGTLIMSFKLTVGRTSILGIDAYHNEAIISIKTYADKDNITRNYLAVILPIIANSGDSKNAIKGKTLNSTSIYNLLVPLPPLAEQKRIVSKIEELFHEIDKLKI